MRNYIEIWFCVETVGFYRDPDGLISTFQQYEIGQTSEECQANVDFDRAFIDRLNATQPPGQHFQFSAGEITPRYFLMNKENVFAIMNQDDPQNFSELFTTESPRDSWSHGK